MSKYILGIVAMFAMLFFAQDAEAGWIFRGGWGGCGAYYAPNYYAPRTYYHPSYYPSCNSGYVVSPPVANQFGGAVQKQAPSFLDQPNPSKAKESTTNPPVIRAPAPSFQDLPLR